MRRLSGVASFLLFLLSVSGCTVQLAPAYDQAVSTGLVTANNDLQALFVSVGDQVSGTTYPSREPAYNHIVAELNALELEIKTRPTPDPSALEGANKVLAKLDIGGVTSDPNFSDYPSARSVHDLTLTIQHMQADDRRNGLRGGQLKAYENQATIYLTQAMTYESFLKR